MQRPLPREWFELQLRFAALAGAIAGVERDTALLRYSGCYLQFGGTGEFSSEDPIWREYLRGLATAADPAGWTYAFYLARWRPESRRSFGCFSYHYVAETRKVRLHFGNADDSGLGALSAARQGARRAELRALFADVAAQHQEALTVRGNSWLHGIAAYRRLYPPEYARTAIPAPMQEEFPYMALWGQFLGSDGQLKRALAEEFLRQCEAATTIAELAACFPNRVYEVECEVRYFYDFYSLEGVPALREARVE